MVILDAYYKLFRKYDVLQGGFVWDFKDQAILKKEGDISYLAYGGDLEISQMIMILVEMD